MKQESLVNADQPRGVEYVLGSCTHRPSSQGSRRRPNSEQSGEGEADDRG